MSPKRILAAVPRWPWPPHQGDRLRTVQMLDLLGEDHEIILLAPEPDEDADPAPKLPGNVRIVPWSCGPVPSPRSLQSILTGAPLQSAFYVRGSLGKKIRSLADEADVGLLQLARLAPHARDFGALPCIVDFVDSLSLNFETRAELDRPWLRPFLRFESRRLARAERRLLKKSAAGLLVSDRDRRVQVRRDGWSTELAERLRVVPLAVEPDASRHPGDASTGPPTVALTGNLGYFVNLDAATWFLRRVWPWIARRRPDVRLLVAGSRPPLAVRRAVAEAGGELVESPPDLRALLAEATVAVAPMRGGSGLPIKILEAWSLGVPVVASDWGAAGTTGVAGEDFLVAREPEEWIDSVLELVDDAEARRRLAEAGRARLEADYSRSRVRAAWEDALASAVSTSSSRSR